MAEIMIARLNHVGVVVRDCRASVEWYLRHFGVRELYDYSFPGVEASFIRKGDFRFEFFQAEGAAPMAHERKHIDTNIKIGGINHFALEVDDINEVFATLQRDGVNVVQPPAEIPGSNGERFGLSAMATEC